MPAAEIEDRARARCVALNRGEVAEEGARPDEEPIDGRRSVIEREDAAQERAGVGTSVQRVTSRAKRRASNAKRDPAAGTAASP